MYFVNHADEYLPTVLCYTINEPLSLSLYPSIVQFILDSQ